MERWRSAVAVFAALVFAVAVPSALVVGWDFWSDASQADPDAWLRLRNFAMLVVLLVSAHVVLLGLPAFLVMHASRAVTWIKSAVAGFAIGAIPSGLFVLSSLLGSASEPSSYLENGRMVYPSAADTWLHAAGLMGFMGSFGSLGGLSFWLAWRGFTRLLGSAGLPSSPNPTL